MTRRVALILVAGLAIVLGSIIVLGLLARGADTASRAPAGGLTLTLPTGNDALLRGEPREFYQALDATIPGVRPEGWMGGQYGFVRNVAQTPVGPVFTRIHQGIDIKPVHRDGAGQPLDTVRAIADGRVVYVNQSPGASSYGRYLVVEHRWDRSPIYTLYAHLDEVTVQPGTSLSAGSAVGRMGYTGAGLARHRAHLHLEIAFLLNRHYEAWHDAFYGSENLHGPFFGRNLMGIDPSALFLALAEEPGLTFREFVIRQPVAYRIAIPGDRRLDLLERYPWLAAEGVRFGDTRLPGSWVVAFTLEGVPVEIARQDAHVAVPQVVYVSEEVQRRYLSTGGVVVRTPEGFQLGRQGRGYAALLATTRADVPPWF